jgi:hypothetical protein
MNALHLTRFALAGVTFTVACAGSASAASADDALNASLQQFTQLQARGEWHNALMPHGTGRLAANQPSGDTVLQAVLAGYDRVALDRGGWSNPWVQDGHYAAGEPLLAAKVGEGVTTAGAARSAPAIALLAAR